MIETKIADYTANLLSFDSDKVVISSGNIITDNFTQDLIIVDSIAPAMPIAQLGDYDYITEEEEHIVALSVQIGLDFLGDNAYTNAHKFVNLQKSQKALDLQKSNGISVFSLSSLTKIPRQKGNRFYDTYTIEITVNYTETFNSEVLRIGEIPDSFTINL